MKFNGVGSYSLLSQYEFAAIPLDGIMTSAVVSPEEIVDKVRLGVLSLISQNLIQSCPKLAKEAHESIRA